ncbi:tripartite tricarboxylate transporter substrate binding protein [Rhodoplanes serenus]|uniref:Tripartite tricarboxylate transporter substrate binding protein n=1 Tax=Rhodoplanes serenus TaxID=200615 RepID=A0A9X4XJZ1_9BRAD|nr:tripartite tricarboxylate transporter substrate binding protein [Rhodoplanes serenus]MTW16453.1 tripartite tricarboxylate transporter substrate binding protein [Rhodoplanes serenus]
MSTRSMGTSNRRTVIAGLAGVAGTLVAGPRRAWAFPTQPITFVVPYAPGSTDQFARAFATEMEKTLGKTIMVETRPGAGGTIGTSYGARAIPDGHTLLFSTSAPLTIAPHQHKLPYKFDDLRPVARVGLGPNVMGARTNAPFKDLESLVAYAKANPEKVTFGSAGTGGSTHLSGEAFARAAGIKLTHIPFQGSTPAVAAAVGGTVDLALGFAQSIVPQARGGRLLAIAQFNKTRAKILPEVPTFLEAGINFALPVHIGIWAPKATPDAIVEQVAVAVEKACTGPAVVEFAKVTVTEVEFAGPDAFGRELAEESAFVKEILRSLGMAS